MDEILKQSLLYDFYGELLTEHQKEIYEQFIVEDLSLSEIAKDAGISRQGVHDLIKRCNKILEEYEEKLHLVEKFLSVKESIRQTKLYIIAVKSNLGHPFYHINNIFYGNSTFNTHCTIANVGLFVNI